MAKEKVDGTQKRINEFDQELAKLQKRYAVKVYAVLQAFENGEVHPIIKIMDDFKLDIVDDEKMYDNQSNTKKGNPIN